LGLVEDRLVAPLSLLPAALLDDEAQVEPAAPPDVLDRLPRPWSPVADPVTVESFGDLGEGMVGELCPDPPDDLSLPWHDDQLARMRQCGEF
jgi:hypothetical protein